jgi:hypothetical protein
MKFFLKEKNYEEHINSFSGSLLGIGRIGAMGTLGTVLAGLRGYGSGGEPKCAGG